MVTVVDLALVCGGVEDVARRLNVVAAASTLVVCVSFDVAAVTVVVAPDCGGVKDVVR